MAGLIDELITLLNQQTEIFEDLAGLSSEKKEAIVKNDLEHLQKITGLENTIVGKNQKLERKRVQLMQDISLVLNAGAADISLSHLAELIKNQPEYTPLVQVSQRLRDTVSYLKNVNEQNRVLISNSLEYIEFSMNLIRSSKQPAFYSSSGEEIAGGSNNFFDAKQ